MPRGWSASAGRGRRRCRESRDRRRRRRPIRSPRPDRRRRAPGRRRGRRSAASRRRPAAAGRSAPRAGSPPARRSICGTRFSGVTSPNAAKVTGRSTPNVQLPNVQPCRARSRLGFFGVENWELGVDTARQQIRRPMANHVDVEPRVTPPGAQLASAGKWTATARAAASGTAVNGQIGAPGLPRPAMIDSATPGGVSGCPKRSSARRSSVRPRAIRACGPRLVQLRVVQDDQARVAGEVGPHVVVAAGVAELVDHQIEGPSLMQRREVVRRADGAPGRGDGGKPVRADAGLGPPRRPDVVADEERDVVARGERRQDHRAVAGDAGADRRERREPGETHLDGWRSSSRQPLERTALETSRAQHSVGGSSHRAQGALNLAKARALA